MFFTFMTELAYQKLKLRQNRFGTEAALGGTARSFEEASCVDSCHG